MTKAAQIARELPELLNGSVLPWQGRRGATKIEQVELRNATDESADLVV